MLGTSWILAMANHSPLGERRGPDRPANGDTRRCPECGAQTLEFSERYRIAPHTGTHIAAPAWICDTASCKYLRFARADDTAAPGAALGAGSKRRTAIRQKAPKRH